MVSDPYPILGLETVLFSLFLPSRNHNLHAGITCRMMRCNASMSLRFGSGWLLIYFWICSCTFIQNIFSMFVVVDLQNSHLESRLRRRPTHQVRKAGY